MRRNDGYYTTAIAAAVHHTATIKHSEKIKHTENIKHTATIKACSVTRRVSNQIPSSLFTMGNVR
jgi:hypothetical protein